MDNFKKIEEHIWDNIGAINNGTNYSLHYINVQLAIANQIALEELKLKSNNCIKFPVNGVECL